MQKKVSGSVLSRSSNNPLLLLLSCLACLYVAGRYVIVSLLSEKRNRKPSFIRCRLWEDSIARKELLLLAQQKVEVCPYDSQLLMTIFFTQKDILDLQSQDQSQAVSTRVTVDESVKLVRYKSV